MKIGNLNRPTSKATIVDSTGEKTTFEYYPYGQDPKVKADLANVQDIVNAKETLEEAEEVAREIFAKAILDRIKSFTPPLTDMDENEIPLTFDGLISQQAEHLMTLMYNIEAAVGAAPLDRSSKRSGSTGPTARKPRRK